MSSTAVTTQTPRGWVALSADARHLVVQGPASVAAQLQGALEAGLVQVLEALGRDGLGGLPDFALVDTSGERARVLVRGAGLVRAVLAHGCSLSVLCVARGPVRGAAQAMHAVRRSPDELLADFAENAGRG